jgi:hypothetical protein
VHCDFARHPPWRALPAAPGGKNCATNEAIFGGKPNVGPFKD